MMKSLYNSTWGIWVAGSAATLAAAILNIIFLYKAKYIFDIIPHVPTTMGGTVLGELGVMQILVVTIIPGIAATVLYWLLDRYTRWPNIIFGLIAVLVLVVSFGGPFSLAIPGYERLVLCILHTIPAVIIAGTLLGTGWCLCCCAGDCACSDDYCAEDECEECMIVCDDCCGECEDCEACEACVICNDEEIADSVEMSFDENADEEIEQKEIKEKGGKGENW